jgi:2-dehydropantoate 2-reductase
MVMHVDRATVVGAGGIGSAVIPVLIENGTPVCVVETNANKVDAANKITGATGIHFEDWQPGADDFVFLCVKCYDNAAVLAKLPESTRLIPIQNGFDEQLDSRPHSVEGIASFVAHGAPDSLEVRITRPGQLHLGFRGASHDDELFAWLKLTFRDALFVPNILPIKYTKLMYNAAISPIAAAAGIDNSFLLSHPTARKLFFALLQENYRILENAGIELGKVGPFHPRTVAKILRRSWLSRLMAKFFEPSLRGTYCSMAGEIQKGRTEIDNYTGHLLKLAEGRTEAPLNRAVYELVKRMERNRETPRHAVLDELV